METIVVDHPLVLARLTQLRDQDTDRATFRSALHQLAHLLLYEATRDVQSEVIDVQTPLASAKGLRIGRPPIMIPVLRAALGMLEAALALFPSAEVGFLGMRRNEETFAAELYLHSVPRALAGHPVLILDPMLATGGSAVQACEAAKECGAGMVTVVCVLAAPEGIARLEETGLADRVVTGAIDDHLNDDAYIVPGLGDAGDRQFGPI